MKKSQHCVDTSPHNTPWWFIMQII